MSSASTRKIGLIGRVDRSKTLFDGQTVKTRMMFRLLAESFGVDRVYVVDTKDYKQQPVSVTAAVVKCLLSCDDIFVLLSNNGRRLLFPILAWAARIRGVRIYHNLIGGWLASDIDDDRSIVRSINQFQVNWVESRQLKTRLEQQGVTNVDFLPNFKYLDIPERAKRGGIGPDYRFCTFSRVTEKKGITDAIKAMQEVASSYQAGTVSLDIYGPIDEDYEREFNSLVKESPFARYCGCVDPEKSACVIGRYDALLFPTKWRLEGMPGTIIDALVAGTPVIASRWQYYDEMLEDRKTGLSYEFGAQDMLAETIMDFINLGDAAVELRAGCLEKAEQYSPHVVRKIIIDEMNKKDDNDGKE